MKTIISFIAIAAIYIFTFIPDVKGQDLMKSSHSGHFKYIYRITDDEAKNIYSHDLGVADLSFFHSLVDSCPFNLTYSKALPAGHYLQAGIGGSRQILTITSVSYFNVFVFNNTSDLCVQVTDNNGQPISGAVVQLNSKKLKFDKAKKIYSDKKSNRRGLLEVRVGNHTQYIQLDREENNAAIKRAYYSVFYRTPLKYVWRPVRFLLFLPVDGIRSIVNHHPEGSIWRLSYFFSAGMYNLFDRFSKYNDRNSWRFEENINSYMVFDKPRYRPGDTVRLKSFITDKRGKTVSEDLNVMLFVNGTSYKLQTISPFRDGAYMYVFPLHDSLKLRLDNICQIELTDTKHRSYCTGYFRYEDYELKKNKLIVKCDNKIQHKGNPLKLSIKAIDDNGLILQDARAEISVCTQNVNKYYSSDIFIRDTLLQLNEKLNPAGETEISIPDSAFPLADLSYSVIVKVRTSDNELNTEKLYVTYYCRPGQIEMTLVNDSVSIRCIENGLSVPQSGVVSAMDAFDNESVVYEGEFPCRIPLNPYFTAYYAESGNMEGMVNIGNKPSNLNLFGFRTKDSLIISSSNPARIPFTYDLYCGNRHIASGSGDSLQIRMKDHSRKIYFLNVNYIWGGEVMNEKRQITFLDKQLNVALEMPSMVFPGKKTTIGVTVTDAKGKPVEGVDVTAYALTSKFRYNAPQLPYLGKYGRGKKYINEFNKIENPISTSLISHADYGFWNSKAGLDTMLYYQFLYPGDTLFRFEYYTTDSVTQFAPFVFSDGNPEAIHIIYVDNMPVYFRWTSVDQPYSFAIDSGYHQIKLRTTNRVIELDSLFFNPGRKMIFSMNSDIDTNNIHSQSAKPELTPKEKAFAFKFILPFRDNFNNETACIINDGKVQLLTPAEKNSRQNLLAGPVYGETLFMVAGKYSVTFMHEPDFEYEFSQNMLKMRSVDKNNLPSILVNDEFKYDIYDSVLTEDAFFEMWNAMMGKRKFTEIHFLNSSATVDGLGALHVSLPGKINSAQYPLCTVLQSCNDTTSSWIYPGTTEMFHNLRTGNYRIIYIFAGEKYQVTDSLHVTVNGITHYSTTQFCLSDHDDYYDSITSLIERRSIKKTQSSSKSAFPVIVSYACGNDGFECGSLQGKVTDGESGEPIPFCNVYIKLADDSMIGCMTDFDGNYCLRNVPVSVNNVTFSSLGYGSLQENDVPVRGNRVTFLDVELKAQSLMLNYCEISCFNEPLIEKDGCASIMRMESVPSLSAADITTYITNIPGIITGGIPADYGDASTGIVRISNNDIQINARENGYKLFANGVKTEASQTLSGGALILVDGKVFTGDISNLNPQLIESINVLSAEKAMTEYGEQGKNGVVIIHTRNISSGENSLYDPAFQDEAEKQGSLRSHFSDVGFWQPDLITDKNGHAEFEVVFPDDVTCWKTYCMAMNGKKQTGQTEDSIRSFKPLMAQLYVPMFLTEGDSCQITGKTLNYSSDSAEVERFFESDGNIINLGRTVFKNIVIDSLMVVADDSIEVKYQVNRSDGYFDGELRKIPVFTQGLEKAEGTFHVLENDTVLSISADSSLSECILYASDDAIDILGIELNNIINYRFGCNEQIASKLMALLSANDIAKFRNEKSDNDREIKKLIRLLSDNQNKDGLWGWWQNTDSHIWMSIHVMSALAKAKSQQYDVPDMTDAVNGLIWQLGKTTDFNVRIKMLKLLFQMNIYLDYRKYLEKENQCKTSTLKDLLQLCALKQMMGIPFSMDTLQHFRQTTLFGNVYYTDGNRETVDNSDVQNTLLMYGILKSDTNDQSKELSLMRNYFFEKRSNASWQNTYESINIIQSILPDMLDSALLITEPALVLSGDTNLRVSEFPFSTTLKPGSEISVSKTGSFPVYFTCYRKQIIRNPQATENDFRIETYFENVSDSTLKAGCETVLAVHVSVKKDAEYVMIRIPVFGGCSYASKTSNVSFESHREYFRNETDIFCQYLPKGTYTFRVKILPRFNGSYNLNPASIELMYFPVFNANNEMKKVLVD
ncbi:MAG: hypothetical protein A2W93_11850 [Bacteroidetes bacterium GWF2_43_63]|nr:MAG: hypothetical protein A2W94_00385 [Bacteroidetes bacterium GWE2_42_42]OFY55437.1 MAG: hypothetical protein A2W93_11850 [Bacteroidetes bacterium GWF2_43_63]HBG70292.1 hypothetical protein [Bacteroidales bacterium]HCB60323.1 hypothetical protein [Bacteroidales bacterium]HCY23565.1 hypothetical protein [Bacteroidales bacterium]